MSSVLDLLQGNGLINVTDDGQIEPPVLVLSSRGGNKIGVIKNVSSIDVTHPLSEVAELSFDVTKEVNGEVYDDWDKVKDFKLVQIPYDNTWYEATVSIDEEDEIVKHVICVHANEAELGQLNLYDTEINTESDIARDDYEETFFYDEDNPKASLLHRILKDKAPHYQIYHVDDSLKKLFRIFSFNGTSIQEALNQIAEEVNCLFIYGEWYENDGKYHRTISAYDLEDYCNECHKRGEYTNHVCTNCGSTDIVEGYGEDTGIFISRENLATSISYESNTDNVKNCFRLVAGDDVMTATVKSCNPSMSQYMWYFSDDMLEDMSTALATKIVDYEELVDSYKNEKEIEIPSSYIETYNTYVDKYGSLNDELVKINSPIKGTAELTEAYYNAMNMYGFLKSELMPASEKVEDTTAEDQIFLLKSSDFTEIGIPSVSGTIPYTTVNSAIQSYAKVFIDTARYKISVFTDDIDGTTWTGTITIKSYTDDEDSAFDSFELELFDSTSNEKYAEWLEQSVQKAMANREVTDLSVVNLFKKDENIEAFKERLKLYSLDYLNIMSSMATSAITIMSEQGVASSDSLDKDIYTQLYKPYLNKSRAIQKEIEVREAELAVLLQPTNEDGVPDPRYQSLGLLDIITNKQDEIRRTLDLHDYLGDELWEELSFYRRETDYTNQNYISDGLTDSEVIEQAKNFVDIASKEIVKAATLQHTISAPLSNFLLMDEFKKLQEKFKVGNWIHLQVDGKVYKLRLANWEVDYDKIDDLDIEFTDAIRVGDIISDVESILSKSRSMATTYEYVARQAEKGNNASNTVKLFRDSGITFTKVKAITSNGNTNIVYDDDGILLKRVDGLEELPEQARIYNNGIYITRDAWETVSTGLGHYSYVDPETGETVETYGIIADTVIGKLILGENLKIYSESGKFEMGDGGLKITARDGEDNTDLFVVQKEKEDEQGRKYVEKYIYVDSNGDVQIAGDSITLGGKPIIEYIDDAIDDAEIDVSLPITIKLDSSTGVVFNTDSILTTLTATVYKGGIDITSQITEFKWTKKDKNGNIDSSWTKTTATNTLPVNIDNVIEKVIISCEVSVNQDGTTTISNDSITISKILNGSQFWTSTDEPVSPDYTFDVSDLVGDTNADIKEGDVIYYSHYRYTITSVSTDGTTVLCGNRESLRGIDGISPTIKSIVCSHSAAVCEKDGTYNPDVITFSGQAQTQDIITNYEGWFVIELSSDSETWVSSYSSASKESFVNYKIPLGVNITKDGIIYHQGSTITVNGSIVDSAFVISSDGVISTTQDIGFIIRSIRCSLYSDVNKTELIDQQRVNIAFDGVDGDKGDDGYTVILSNENHTFAGNSKTAVASYTDCDVIAYVGGVQTTCNIGAISGCPDGMLTTILNNDTTTAKFRVSVTTAMTSQNGVLNVPVTVNDDTTNGKLFNMKFTYSLKLNGLDATGLGWMVNYSAPTVANDGECIYFGFDDVTKEPSFEKDGWVIWNGEEIIIPHGCYVNPNDTMPYNTTIYSVYRLPTPTTYTGGTFHDVAWIEATNSWKSNTYNGTTPVVDSNAWVWDEDRDIILSMYVEPSNDGEITNAQLFTPPKKYSELVEPAKGMAKDAEKVASYYLVTEPSTGTMIADMSNGTRYLPSEIPANKRNILLTDTAVKIRNGQTDLATYGDTITLGQNSGKNVQIGSNGVTINDGNDQLASYGSDVVIGKTTTPHLEMDGNGISAYRDSTNKYFEVGSGSSNVVETHAISETPLIVNLDYPIATISSVTVNNIATDEYSYNVGDEFIILNDRPVGSCDVSVQYSYMSYVDDDDEQGTEITATQTLNYEAMPALAITLSDTASTVNKVSVNGTQISNYTFNNNTITLNNRPSTGSEIEIEYTVSKIAPYFTFNERDAVAEKGIGSASFSDNGAASGVSSFITGINGEASGRASFVSGVDSNATGEASSALGKGTIASSSGGLSCGRYNNGGNDYLFAVGNGTDDSNRSNAFVVTENGNTLISNRILNGNGKPLFTSQYFSTVSASVQPTKAKQFKVNIAKQGYTPIAISYDQILGTNSSWCSVYRRVISGNYVYFFIRDISSVLTATVNVGFKIFYISNSAM